MFLHIHIFSIFIVFVTAFWKEMLLFYSYPIFLSLLWHWEIKLDNLFLQAYVIPYPGDCSRYQQCDVSGCFVMRCGRGTEFNPAIGTCDYPLRDRTECNNRGWELFSSQEVIVKIQSYFLILNFIPV